MSKSISSTPESQGVSFGQKIFFGIGVMAAGKAVIISIGFVTRIVLARLLGPAGLGIYGLFTNAVGLCVLFANMGTQNTQVHDLGRGRTTLESALGFSLFCSLSAGLLAVIGFYLAYHYWLYDWYFAKYLNEKYPPVLWVFMAIPVRILMLHLTHVVLGLKRFKTYNVFLLIEVVFLLILLITLCPHIHPSLLGALLAWMGASLATAILLLLHLAAQISFSIRIHIFELGHKLSYGSKAMASGLTQTLTLQLGLFIVGYFLEPAEVGLYFLAYTLFATVSQMSIVLNQVLFPYNSSVDFDQAVKLTNRIFRTFLPVSLLTLFLFIPASFYGVSIVFGSVYKVSGYLLIILLPGAIALSLIRIIYAFFLGQGHPEKAIIAYIYSLITVGILDIILVPWLGMTGAATGLTGAYIVGLVTIVRQYISLTKTSFADLCLIRSTDFQILKKILLKVRSRLRVQMGKC